MFNWAKGALAVVAGTQEPEYGPEAIHTVSEQAKKTPYTVLSKESYKWLTPETSCVETQTFYVHTDAGPFAFVQLIYSNLGISPTVQFNTQVYYLDGKTPALWHSDTLENWDFGEEKYNFNADAVAVDLSEDGTTYTIKSTRNADCTVNLTFTHTVPPFVVGQNGTTLYGTDPAHPWGTMHHTFWPRCKVEGGLVTPTGEISLAGKGMFIHALQGMKPHHCAARWNFVNFQSPHYTAMMMEYTTPPSYATTTVNVGGITSEDKILFAGADNVAEHTETKQDEEVDWPEPTVVRYHWKGTVDGKEAEAELVGPLGTRLDRVDIMGELPGFIKSLASAAAGTRPYIYQYGPKLTLKLKIGDETIEEEGIAFAEATFIS